MGCGQEVSTSTVILPISASDITSKRNKIRGITFGADHIYVSLHKMAHHTAADWNYGHKEKIQ